MFDHHVDGRVESFTPRWVGDDSPGIQGKPNREVRPQVCRDLGRLECRGKDLVASDQVFIRLVLYQQLAEADNRVIASRTSSLVGQSGDFRGERSPLGDMPVHIRIQKGNTRSLSGPRIGRRVQIVLDNMFAIVLHRVFVEISRENGGSLANQTVAFLLRGLLPLGKQSLHISSVIFNIIHR